MSDMDRYLEMRVKSLKEENPLSLHVVLMMDEIHLSELVEFSVPHKRMLGLVQGEASPQLGFSFALYRDKG